MVAPHPGLLRLHRYTHHVMWDDGFSMLGAVWCLQEAQEMVLLKFKPDLPPPVVQPSLEQLSRLIKTNLHYPETYSHSFVHQR